MKNIDGQIKIIENKIVSCNSWSKFFMYFFKVIIYIHIGFAGSFAVSAMKDLMIGNFLGLFMFGGLLISSFVTYGIGEFIQKLFRSRKESLEIKLHGLNLMKNELQRNKNEKKSLSYSYLNYNSYGNNLSKDMRLTLRK